MQIVIDIDDNLYTRLFDNGEEYAADMRRACVAIRKGIPLPKGHGRLVDIDKVRTELDWLEKVTNEGSVVEQAAHRKLIQCINVVNAASTIIEAERM